MGDFDGGQSITGSGGGGGGGFLQSLMGMIKGGDGAFSNILQSLALAGQFKGFKDANKIQKGQLSILGEQQANSTRAADKNFNDAQFMAQQIGGLAPPVTTSLAGISPEEALQISP